jgi:inosine-uridine nucleoside N-ribohydrolase
MRPFAIDTDPGIDDALALLFALGLPDVTVEALTTVAGNVELAIATANAGRILDLAAPSRRPAIVPGAAAPLSRPLRTATEYHGHDGLGDVLPQVAVQRHADGREGPDVIVEMARRHGSMLTIVTLGPLTNLALAVERDRAALSRVGRIVAMGGAVDVPGNVTPVAEFNVHVDPEAARCVVEAGLPLALVPLDVTQRTLLSRARLHAALEGAPADRARFVSAITRRAFASRDGTGERSLALHDPLAIGVAADPSIVGLEEMCLRVGSEGETRRAAGPPNCRVATRVDAPRFTAWFLEALCRASS